MAKLNNARYFWHNAQGLAALEFALFAPILLILCLGGYDMARYLIINQKVEKIAYTLADITAQSTTLTNTQISQIMAASTEIIKPYAFGADGYAIISSVYQTGAASGANPPTVRWQRTGGGTYAKSSKVGSTSGYAYAALPGGLSLSDKDNVIVAEVYYRFTPLFASLVLPSRDIYRSAVFKPRLGALTTPPS